MKTASLNLLNNWKWALPITAAVIVVPLCVLANDTPESCEPDWRFFGWSRGNCGLDGGSQGVSHSHLPDNSACVYY
ncbi:hypothetical protein [Aquirufa echingensis]|uniref:Secreted protein n=1 Tax=Aquirufa echingensis TaxID=3096516 RepID=A0ABW6D231_9BACT